MNLFPVIAPAVPPTKKELPLCRETAWDYREDRPVFLNGNPVFVEGKEAVQVWAWNALHTARARYEIYSRDYGHELETLIGQPYTEGLKQAEAMRYVRECLVGNPYIKAVTESRASFRDGLLEIECTLETVYGEVNICV